MQKRHVMGLTRMGSLTPQPKLSTVWTVIFLAAARGKPHDMQTRKPSEIAAAQAAIQLKLIKKLTNRAIVSPMESFFSESRTCLADESAGESVEA